MEQYSNLIVFIVGVLTMIYGEYKQSKSSDVFRKVVYKLLNIFGAFMVITVVYAVFK